MLPNTPCSLFEIRVTHTLSRKAPLCRSLPLVLALLLACRMLTERQRLPLLASRVMVTDFYFGGRQSSELKL